MNAIRYRLILLLFCCTATPAAFSQVVSINTVGYLFRPISPGDNLIANQFDNETGNTLNSLFNGPGLQTGTTFTKWDSTANQFVPASFYDSASGTWSINYTLTFGEGGLLRSPSMFTNLFLGSVYLGYNLDNGELTWNPGYSAGLHLLSSPIPATGFSGLPSFEQAVGRAPVDGEWVKTLDEATQTYTLTTYHSGSGWDNGEPNLGLGQAAWFDLAAVPEPSTLALAGLATATLLRGRRSGTRANTMRSPAVRLGSAGRST